jgi:hypothetical protein
MNSMHLDDFVVLGRTVPEESKKYGTRICMAGYSPGVNQFLRVYPLLEPVGANKDANWFKSRHRYEMDLQRNPNDNRCESWRVLDERRPTKTPWDRAPEVKKPELLRWLRGRAVPSIAALNDCRLSLGVLVVEAGCWDGQIVQRDDKDIPEAERSLFADLEVQPDVDASRVRYAPYIRFCDEGGDHRLQVREWGANILLAKPDYSDRPEALWSAAGYRQGHDLVLVVGNMCNHRNNWLIIKTFEVDKEPVGTALWDAFGGLPEGE